MLQVFIDETKLLEEGYVSTEKFGHVAVSLNLVAKIHGVSTATVVDYVNLGLIPSTENKKVVLSDALLLDFKKIHDDYISKRKLTIRRKKP